MKIRGYRIELTEIESVLLQLPQIAQAVVDTYEPEPGAVELVAYYTLKQGVTDAAARPRSREALRKQPAGLHGAGLSRASCRHPDDGRATRPTARSLPAPKGPRFSARSGEVRGAANARPRATLADALAEVMKIERVSVEDNFFKDLGAHSLLMARFCAEIRQAPGLSDVSMRDIYLNPTIAQARRTICDRRAATRAPVAVEAASRSVSRPTSPTTAAARCSSVLCRLRRIRPVADRPGVEWTYAAVDSPVELYLRIVAFAAGSFVALTALPIAAKWLLIGRWKEEAIPIWSLRYFRFWVVKTLVQQRPDGAVRRHPDLQSSICGCSAPRSAATPSSIARLVPVCTDLLSIGDNTIIRKDSILLGYKAQSNYIHTGPITIGDNAFVGEASVLDIDTAMGDDTQLGHASSLQSGQRVPRRQALSRLARAGDAGRLLPGRATECTLAAALALCRRASWSPACSRSSRRRS